jgi:uncharacterized protein (DUF362 family)
MADSLVRTVFCDHRADDVQIVATVEDLLEGLRPRLAWLNTARRILVKTNIGYNDFRQHHGRYVAITEPAVVEGVVAFLRRHSAAEICVAEAATEADVLDYFHRAGYLQRLAPYDVQLVDLNRPPFAEYAVPQGGTIFRSYTLSAEFQAVDAVISVAKLKSHLSTGATATLKNFFAVPPVSIYGDPRRYLHAAVRLPRTVVDMTLVLKPVLGVIDALVCADQQEWYGPPVETNLLLAGDDLVATDATAMRFMGIDPSDNYPHPPYLFDDNPVLLAAGVGLGTLKAEEITIEGPEPRPLFPFAAKRHWQPEVVEALRRSTAEQALLYDQQRERFRSGYEGKHVYIARGEVVWSGDSLNGLPTRGELARKLGDAVSGLFLKRVGPASEDPEIYERYREVLDGDGNGH